MAASDFPRSPTVVAVVPTRNRQALTLRFLDQMAAQTYPALSVVIVDANSSDGTPEVVRQRYPAVRVLAGRDRDFWASATNQGVRYALATEADYVLTINDDAVVEPHYVEHLVALAQTHGCQILGSQINFLADRDRVWAMGSYTTWGTQDFLRLAYTDQTQGQLPPSVAQAALIAVDALPGNGVLIHHSVYHQIGLYHARLMPHYHADSEFVMRAIGHGINAYVTPQAIVYNDFSPQQKQLPLKSLRGLAYTFGHPKSHLYLPAVAYIFGRYCPIAQKWPTLKALGQRFRGMQRYRPSVGGWEP
jgi:GT2 family glycosyltransferase